MEHSVPLRCRARGLEALLTERGAAVPEGGGRGITRQAIRRGSFTWVKDLIAAIEAFIDGWNDRGHPFTWTKTPDELLPRCKPGKRNLVHARWPRH